MSRRLNDGEAFKNLNGRVKRPRNRVRASLAALQWAANGAGHSYGMFTQRLTAEDEVRIQELDEAWRCDELEYEKEKRLD